MATKIVRAARGVFLLGSKRLASCSSRLKKIFAFVACNLAVWSAAAFSQVATPEFAPDAADGATNFDVTITCATAGATIRYTKDGNDPTGTSEAVPGNGKVHVDRHVILKARAFAGGQESAVKSAYYRVTGALTAGGAHTIGLKSNGTLWSWGEQGSGRLGNGATGSGNVFSSPVPVTKWVWNGTAWVGEDVTNAVAVDAGNGFNLLADTDGKLFAFGENNRGQIGDNTTTDVSRGRRVLKADVPYTISIPENQFLGNSVHGPVTAVSAGWRHALAIEAGKVWGWGERAGGRIGDGYVGASASRQWATPVLKVTSLLHLDGAVQVAAGKNFSMALCNVDSQGRGQVWTWGANGSGQLGLNSASPGESGHARMAKFSTGADLNTAVEIAAGWEHAVVILRDGGTGVQSVWCWGERQGGRLGNNGSTNGGTLTAPVQVVTSTLSNLTGIVQVSAGPRHSLALASDGKVWSWGNNGDGQLGDTARPTGNSYSTASTVKLSTGTELTGIVAIAAGGHEVYDVNGVITAVNSFSLALHEDGTIYSWGQNGSGQLGTGNTTSSAYAVATGYASLRLSHRKPTLSTLSRSSILTAPASVLLTASTTVTDAPITHVNFFQTAAPNILGSDSDAGDGYTFQLSPLGVGSYTFSAIAYDSLGEPSVEKFVSFSVTKPTATVLSAPTTINEGGAAGNVVIKRDSIKPVDLTVRFTLTGSATEGADYTAVLHEVTIPAGFDTVNVPLAAYSDSFSDPETIVFTLVADASDEYTVTGTAKTISIKDFQAVWLATTSPYAKEPVNSGGTGAIPGKITFYRDHPSTTALTVAASIATGLPTTAVVYSNGTRIGTTLTATIPANQTSVTVDVLNPFDTAEDGYNDITYTLNTDADYDAHPSSATIWVIDWKPLYSVEALQDGFESGPVDGRLRFRREAPYGDVILNFNKTGTAILNTDYQVANSVFFPHGVQEKIVPVTVLDDDLAESAETVIATIPTNTNYSIVSGMGAATVNIYSKTANTIATPAINPNGGPISSGATITVTCTTPGVEFRYTLDGTWPNESSTLMPGGLLILNHSAKLIVRAYKVGMDPSNYKTAKFLTGDGTGDYDDDGLTDAQELNETNTNPALADSNGNGLSDGEDLSRGFDPLDIDIDNDGVTNLHERMVSMTRWWDADSDDDGFDDSGDGFPLDPTRATAPPPPNPSDTTPPVIGSQLIKPFGVTLQNNP